MVSNLKAVIKKNQISVFVLTPGKFSQQMVEITKALSDIKKSICYVSLNKPYNTISDGLTKAGVPTESMNYIDAVSSNVGSAEAKTRVAFVSSPRALTELNIAITKGIGQWKSDVVLFDSLSTLCAYEGASSIIRFVHSVINSLRIKGISCVFTIFGQDLKAELEKDLGMFADKIEVLK